MSDRIYAGCCIWVSEKAPILGSSWIPAEDGFFWAWPLGMSDITSRTPRHGKYRERHQMHHDHQQAKKQARAKKVADALKRHTLRAKELEAIS